jgi:ceramide synthetase
MFRKPEDKYSSPKSADAKMIKWTRSCWKLTTFTLFTLLALGVSYNEVWFTDTKHFWIGCSRVPCELFVSKKLLLFYCVAAGFYLQAIPLLFSVEARRRKDWLECIAHDTVTLALLFYSFCTNTMRVGLMVMLVHDASDIFIEWAKLARYSGRQDWATIHFVVFTTLWFALRVLYFPLVLIRSTLFEPIELWAKPHNLQPEPHYSLCNGMLTIILILDVYWSWHILKCMVKQLTEGEAKDTREKED